MSASAADVARRDAVRALEARLRGWGVETPLLMAQRFIDDLTRQGWVWAPVDRRRAAPRRHQECPRHPGEWSDACRPCAAERIAKAEEESTEPVEPQSTASEYAALCKAQLASYVANVCSHGVLPARCRDCSSTPKEPAHLTTEPTEEAADVQ